MKTLKIGYENREMLIDDIYVHDSFFAGFCYNYEEKKISFSCKNNFLKKCFSFDFQNVIFLNVQSCGFWGGGNCVLWIELLENSKYMQELVARANKTNSFEFSALDTKTRFLEIEIQINSGDAIFIICESLDFLEEDLE